MSETTRAAAGLLLSARRPRVLLLSTWHPEPAENGRKQRTRRMIEALADAYDVILVSFLPEDDPPEPLPAVPGVHTQCMVRLPGASSSPLRLAASAFQRYPRSQVTIWSQTTAVRVGDIVRQTGAQVVIGTDLRTVRYLTHLPPRIITILDEPDVSWVVDPCEAAAGPFGGLRTLARQRKYRRLLHDTAGSLNGVVVASELESRAYQMLAAAPAPVVIENGIAALPEPAWRPPSAPGLLYTGSINYPPNHDAIEFMSAEVLPRLDRAGSELRLTVTGALPAALPASMRSPQLQFTGVLPQLDGEFRSASVFVCPLRSGTGTRIKLIEAMAYGMPIVSTRKGAEGLAVEDGVHLILAEGADEFTGAIQTLLADQALALKLGAHARELVRRRYTWESQGALLRALVGQLIQSTAVGVTHG